MAMARLNVSYIWMSFQSFRRCFLDDSGIRIICSNAAIYYMLLCLFTVVRVGVC